ncbi:hypothetical protein FG386_000033 [Cryptosporidium ryanae]|uniref:uncharacterized protein n=1 Tax=Cryptosporidium ryanae TaxID=515981 RepID=UPI00351A7472|nr:hypothetical protein FG386_000033 [Cryptosporidium ryanae]
MRLNLDFKLLLLYLFCIFNLSNAEGGDEGLASRFPIFGALFSAASKAFDKVTPDECYQLNKRGLTNGPIGLVLAALPYKPNYPVMIFKDGWQQPDYLIAAVLIEMWHRFRAAEALFDPSRYRGANKLLGAQAFWGNSDEDPLSNPPNWEIWWSELGGFFSGVGEIMEILRKGTIPLFVSTRGLQYNTRFLLSTLDLYAREKLETIEYLRGGTTKDGKSCSCRKCGDRTPIGDIPSHLGIFTDTEGAQSYSAINHLKLLYERLEKKMEDEGYEEEEISSPQLDEWGWDSEHSYVGAFIIYVRKIQQKYHHAYNSASRSGRIFCGIHVHDLTECIKNTFKYGKKALNIPINTGSDNNGINIISEYYPPWFGNDKAWKIDPRGQIIRILQFLDDEDLNTTKWDTMDYVVAAAFQYLRIRRHLHQVWTGGWLHKQTSPNFIKRLFKSILRIFRLGGKIPVI